MKSLTVQCYGALREVFGEVQQPVLSNAVSCADLWDELINARGLHLDRERVRVAVDDQFATWDSSLTSGQSVAFMPPFAGG